MSVFQVSGMDSRTLLRRTNPLTETVCLLWFLVCAIPALAEPVFKVGFVAPADPADPFFSEVVEVMQAAADDLNIELKVDYSGRNMSMYARKRGLKLINTYKPDYFLTGFWPGGAKYHLQGAEVAGIQSFVFNAPVITDEDFSVTTPRRELPSWLGQMTPDNQKASYQLSDILIEEARKRKLQDDKGKVHLVALNGEGEDISARHRMDGLKARINQHKDVILHEIVLAGWMKGTADRETERMLQAYPETSVIWAASDHMALGAAEAAERVGRKPGEDIIIGGFDWNEANLRDIKAGRITASIGGHIFEGALVLILLYDYHKGIDFTGELGVKFYSPMHAITAGNVDQYQALLGDVNWNSIDFTKFSKALNPAVKRYDFSLSTLLGAIRVEN